MYAVDLAHYQIDCGRKAEQIKFLNSMRTDRDDRMFNGAANAVQPWTKFSDPQHYSQRHQIHNGRTNWIINQKLLRLAYDCP